MDALIGAPEAGAPASSRLSLMLNAEISAVITAMRANAKWAVVPNKYNVRSVQGSKRVMVSHRNHGEGVGGRGARSRSPWMAPTRCSFAGGGSHGA